jgi:uncharacterized membrane-anchored protein
VKAEGAVPGRPQDTKDAGYTALGYMLAGMIAYGAIGWAIGRAVHPSLALTVALPIGALLGLALGVTRVIYRYGRS